MSATARRAFLQTAGLGAAAAILGCAAAPSVGVAGSGDAGMSHGGKYELPKLPYGYDALEPAISADILRVHHDKHHAGYVNGLNGTLDRLEAARKSGDYGPIKALSRALAFHGSGHVLHDLYWKSMRPGGAKAPAGHLRQAIQKDFGSFEAFEAQFKAATKSVEASGWGIFGYEPLGGRLVVLQAERHQDLTIWGVAPLMVCDVWEHAYYLQYKNRRGEYVEAFWNIVDWPAVERRYAAIQ